jgi:hypothetical protein
MVTTDNYLVAPGRSGPALALWFALTLRHALAFCLGRFPVVRWPPTSRRAPNPSPCPTP